MTIAGIVIIKYHHLPPVTLKAQSHHEICPLQLPRPLPAEKPNIETSYSVTNGSLSPLHLKRHPWVNCSSVEFARADLQTAAPSMPLSPVRHKRTERAATTPGGPALRLFNGLWPLGSNFGPLLDAAELFLSPDLVHG